MPDPRPAYSIPGCREHVIRSQFAYTSVRFRGTPFCPVSPFIWNVVSDVEVLGRAARGGGVREINDERGRFSVSAGNQTIKSIKSYLQTVGLSMDLLRIVQRLSTDFTSD